jgi:hypothetical protein
LISQDFYLFAAARDAVGELARDRRITDNLSLQFRIECRRKFTEPFANLRARPCGKSKRECGLGVCSHEAGRQRRWPDTNLGADARNRRHLVFPAHPGDEMQACFWDFEHEVLTQQIVELFDKEFSSL